MTERLELPTRADLGDPALTKLLHSGTSVGQPDVFRVRRKNHIFVVKDFGPRPLWARVLHGRRMIQREYAVLRALDGLLGVPRVLGRLDEDAFVMEHIESVPLPSRRSDEDVDLPSSEFFTEVKQIVAGMHEAGIAHGDIRRKNILCSADGRAWLIDFASAITRDGTWRWLKGPLYQVVRAVDRITVLKLQASYYPDSLTVEEQECLQKPPWFLRLGRFLRHDIYRRFIKQRTWRKRFRRWCQRMHGEGSA